VAINIKGNPTYLLKIITIVMYILLVPILAFAQYNDTVNYYTGLSSMGTLNQTESSSSYLLNNILKLGIKKKDYSLNSTNGWVYGSQNRILTNNDFNSVLDFDVYKLLPHCYYWGLIDYTSSFSLKINSQYQVGAGIAYNIIDHKNSQLNISDGIVYEKSDIFLYDTVRDLYDTYRNSFRLAFKWNIGSIFSINGMGYFQNSFSLKKDYIIRTNVAMSIKLKKWLSFTASYIYNRFNRINTENSLLTYGLTIDRYY